MYQVVEAPLGGSVDSSGLYTAPGSAGTYHVKVTDSIGNESIATVTVQAPVTWDIDSIDAGLKTGWWASLALDSAGLPRIAYYESVKRELRYAEGDGTSWSAVVVDGDKKVGQYASLALGTGGEPRIAYYDADKKDLRYIGGRHSLGRSRADRHERRCGAVASLALDPSTGDPRIAYYDLTNSRLMYVEKNGASWRRRSRSTMPRMSAGSLPSLSIRRSARPSAGPASPTMTRQPGT